MEVMESGVAPGLAAQGRWRRRLRALQTGHVPIRQIGHEVAVQQAAPRVVHGGGLGQRLQGSVGPWAAEAPRSSALSGTTRLLCCSRQTEAPPL